MNEEGCEPRTEAELFDQLEKVKTAFESETSVPAEIVVERWCGALSPVVGAAIVDLVRESLSGVPADVRARRVNFRLYEGYFMVRLLISYAGVSFRNHLNLNAQRVKLNNMAAKVGDLGGTFDVIADEAGVGTRVRVVIPKPHNGKDFSGNVLGSGRYISSMRTGHASNADFRRIA